MKAGGEEPHEYKPTWAFHLTLLSLNRVLDWPLCYQELTSRSSSSLFSGSTSTFFSSRRLPRGMTQPYSSSSFRAVSSITHVVVSPDASGCVWVSLLIPSFFPSDTRKMKNKSSLLQLTLLPPACSLHYSLLCSASSLFWGIKNWSVQLRVVCWLPSHFILILALGLRSKESRKDTLEFRRGDGFRGCGYK